MIYKNWPSDAQTDYVLYEHLSNFYLVEPKFLEGNEDELVHEGMFEELVANSILEQ